MLDALLCLLDGTREISLPYQMGSAEADAYLAGKDEGRRLAQELTRAACASRLGIST